MTSRFVARRCGGTIEPTGRGEQIVEHGRPVLIDGLFETGQGSLAEVDHLIDFDQCETAEAKAGVIDETIGFLDVTREGFAEGGEGVLINADEQFRGGGCGEDFVEEGIQRGVGHSVETERWFAHFADALSPRGGVFGAVVRVQTECHLELIDWLSGETFDEDFVQPFPRPVMMFQAGDAVLNREADLGGVFDGANSGYGREVKI